MNEEALRAELKKRERAISGGAGWLYWIAGISILNTLVTFFGWDWNFMIGLGLMQLVESLFQETSTLVKGIGLILNLLAAGLFLLLGYQARKRIKRAFMTAFIFYFLDSLIFLVLGEYVNLGFHALALFMILEGYSNIGKVAALAARIGQPQTREEAAAITGEHGPEQKAGKENLMLSE